VCWYVVFWSIIVSVGFGFFVRIIGFARISAVFASSFIVVTFIVVVCGGVFGGSVVSIIRSLYGAMSFSMGVVSFVFGFVFV